MEIFLRIVKKIHLMLRIYKYHFLSDAFNKTSNAVLGQPVLFTGKGKITLGKCSLGCWPSPFFHNGYAHIEAREASASVVIADGVVINNNACIIAERTSVSIAKDTLIGPNLCIFDSDFHGIDPSHRQDGSHACAPVFIGENVFIGFGVTILKGVTVGSNSVIASGSIVTKSVPENVVFGGNPGRVISVIA
ncbi:DapH/DapD/GlmU-related protein [Candidatus Njordibacter sp. Uisw_002]|uniref:DapH/DapD/GlmU-related protein n=1 Tax=Candidatus Njordibacter sp. Uisw_002 TaxID=3230971 RepID=UPI003D3CFA13